jgi:hypothetical protein
MEGWNKMAFPTSRPEHALSWLDNAIRVAPLQLADSWKKQQVGPLNGRHFLFLHNHACPFYLNVVLKHVLPSTILNISNG